MVEGYSAGSRTVRTVRKDIGLILLLRAFKKGM